MAWSSTDLVSALRRKVLDLETDLRARVDGDDHALRQPGVWQAWESDYDAAFAAQRTAATWAQWRDERVTQAAVAWVLLTVFARYCEDNDLVSLRWIAGADADHRTQALDARRAYFQNHPEHTDREWLGEIIAHFGKYSATAALVDSFSPLHLVSPSGDAARALLEFWWQQGDDGQPRYSFTGIDTRFLGDAYQDLSEYAKKTYALLQTPDFVEEFILDQTLEPALADRPLEGFTVIDPACGSGHFLLGAFHRLHRQWQRHAPGLGARELVARALDSVYGVDINPFAVAIARFRLLVAALHAAGDTSIEQRIGYTPHLAAGDSLLWGAPQQALDDDLMMFGNDIRADSTENTFALKEILHRHHDAVVGNPPFITPKDAALNATYRQLYIACHRQYALTVPFMELFFNLAYPAGADRPTGWVGQITSNSFMKREFGSRLIEEFLPTVDLRTVIDTSGAYVPGHATPTVILLGRNQSPSTQSVRAVLGARGEPTRPAIPSKGLVWRSIVDHITEPGFENPYITVSDLPRAFLQGHPWSLSGGGAVGLARKISAASGRTLQSAVLTVGFMVVTREDDAYLIGQQALNHLGIAPKYQREVIAGNEVRDWVFRAGTIAVCTYDESGNAEADTPTRRLLWPLKQLLLVRRALSGTQAEQGLEWWEYSQLNRARFLSRRLISFAEVATHNHFTLDTESRLFIRTAPVISLPVGASVEDHLRLLGLLNSSVACFWLKQKSHKKGGGGHGGGSAANAWSHTHVFTGATLKEFPIPSDTPLSRAEALAALAAQLMELTPRIISQREVPTQQGLEAARTEFQRVQSLMVAHQEELDWEYYRIYGLINDDLTYSVDVPGIALGERAFEIALARRMKIGEEETGWFTRHDAKPQTDIPAHLPAAYRTLLQRRLDAIASDPNIRLLERPEYKRRWAMEPWDKQVESALRGWLLDRAEDRVLWFDRDGRPTPRSVAQLADLLDRDAEFRDVLRLWAGDPNAATGTSLAKLLADEAVPFLSAYRYKPSGLDKRADWEHTWALQRREDAGEKLDSPIPVPPKYKPTDFARPTYWSHRGKLDVPKERFISYPNAGRDTDPTELLGWAGWDHAEQALAVASLVSARTEEGWDTLRLIPLLAGLHELAPWVRQWHNEIDPEYGESVADTIDTELAERLAEHHLTTTDLTTWRPAPATRGRRARTS